MTIPYQFKSYAPNIQPRFDQPQFYLIWSIEHQGWWKPSRVGYTKDIQEAGQYTYREAVAICHDENKYVIDDQSYPNEAMVPILQQ